MGPLHLEPIEPRSGETATVLESNRPRVSASCRGADAGLNIARECETPGNRSSSGPSKREGQKTPASVTQESTQARAQTGTAPAAPDRSTFEWTPSRRTALVMTMIGLVVGLSVGNRLANQARADVVGLLAAADVRDSQHGLIAGDAPVLASDLAAAAEYMSASIGPAALLTEALGLDDEDGAATAHAVDTVAEAADVPAVTSATSARPEDFVIVTRGELAEGESLGQSLSGLGIDGGTIALIESEMRGIVDFTRLRPGDKFRLGQDLDGRVLDFRYAHREDASYYLYWDGTDYAVREGGDGALRPGLEDRGHRRFFLLRRRPGARRTDGPRLGVRAHLRLGHRLQPQRPARRRVRDPLRAALSHRRGRKRGLRPTGSDPRGPLRRSRRRVHGRLLRRRRERRGRGVFPTRRHLGRARVPRGAPRVQPDLLEVHPLARTPDPQGHAPSSRHRLRRADRDAGLLRRRRRRRVPRPGRGVRQPRAHPASRWLHLALRPSLALRDRPRGRRRRQPEGDHRLRRQHRA